MQRIARLKSKACHLFERLHSWCREMGRARLSRLTWRESTHESLYNVLASPSLPFLLRPSLLPELLPCWLSYLPAASDCLRSFPFAESEVKYAFRMVDCGARTLQVTSNRACGGACGGAAAPVQYLG